MNKIIHFTSKINISCLCAILGILTQTHTYLFSYIFLATYTLLLRTYGRRHRFMLLIYAFFCLYPAILEHHYQTQLDQLKTETTEKTLTLRFLEPLFSNKQGSVLVKDIKNKHIYRLQYRENVFQKQPDYSDIYRSRVSIHFPSPARNPGTRDQRLFFQRKQIYGTLHPSSARFLKTGFQNPIKTLAFRLKRSLLELHGSVLPEPYQDLLTSLIFGTHATRLPFKLQDMFKRTGLTHLLVVSGSQVSLLSGILFVLLTPLKHARKTRFISLAIIQFLFYFLTGGGASIGRAIIMNMILYYCRLFQKKQAPFFGFSTTIVIMLIINPFLLLDIGAQLSFLASFSLVYGVPAITKKLPQKLPFKTAIALSLSPFLFTQPLLIAQFQTVSPISLISNLITLQLIECLVIVGFFSTWIGFFYLPLSAVLFSGCHFIMKSLVYTVEFLSSLPYASFYIANPPAIITVLLYFALFFALSNTLSKPFNYYFFSTSSGLIIVSFILNTLPSATLRVSFLDVGQGDSILIETPSKKIILIDAGGKFLDWKTKKTYQNMGRSVVYPVLKSKGINRIDFLITSHFDNDHVGGIPFLIRHFRIGALLDNGRLLPPSNDYQAAANTMNLTRHTLTSETSLEIEKNCYLDILSPEQLPSLSQKNNASLVLLLRYKDISFLFTGDIEAEIEKAISSAIQPVSVLKIAHHGSHSSSTMEFINQTQPLVSIISCGIQNRYKHPSKHVLKRLQSIGTTILRTDQQGAIEMETDGHTLSYRTMLPAI